MAILFFIVGIVKWLNGPLIWSFWVLKSALYEIEHLEAIVQPAETNGAGKSSIFQYAYWWPVAICMVFYRWEEGLAKLRINNYSMVDALRTGFTKWVFRKYAIFIPLVSDEFIKQNKGPVLAISSSACWFGVTYKEDKQIVQNSIDILIQENIYPSSLWQPDAI